MICNYISEVHKLIASMNTNDLERIIEQLIIAYQEKRQVFIIGNGGSAATASHFACDLAKGANIDGKERFIVSSLNDNMALVTAISNDIGYEFVFEEQLKNQVKPKDIVIAISASGNSPNIIKGIEYAKSKGAIIIGLSGFSGGKLRECSDYNIHVDSYNYGIVEDLHLMSEHIISQELREKIMYL